LPNIPAKEEVFDLGLAFIALPKDSLSLKLSLRLSTFCIPDPKVSVTSLLAFIAAIYSLSYGPIFIGGLSKAPGVSSSNLVSSDLGVIPDISTILSNV